MGVSLVRCPHRKITLTLDQYLNLYTASSKDGYRRDVKEKNDQEKIDLI